jgi:RAP domain
MLPEVTQIQEEVRTKSGYRLDAVIVYRGDRFGVEIDGPFHVVGRSPTPNGRTVLKHRQLRALEGWNLVSIPYWEWDEICDDASRSPTLESRKHAYLRNLLARAVIV